MSELDELTIGTFEQRVQETLSRQPFMTALGVELVSLRRGAAEVRFPYSPEYTQHNGFLHAGAVSGVLDSTCGYAGLTVIGEDKELLAVEYKINFLAPCVGESFVARAKVKRAGQKIIVCSADAYALRAGKEKLVATMIDTIIVVPNQKATAK